MAITSSKEVAGPSLTQFACVSLRNESGQDFQGIPCSCVSPLKESNQDVQDRHVAVTRVSCGTVFGETLALESGSTEYLRMPEGKGITNGHEHCQ